MARSISVALTPQPTKIGAMRSDLPVRINPDERQRRVAQSTLTSTSVSGVDRHIRVVAVTEVASVTDTAKNVIEFATRTAARNADQVPADLSIIALVRGDERRDAFAGSRRLPQDGR